MGKGKAVVRKGDVNSGGGVLTVGHHNITVNGIPAGKQGGSVTPHRCCGRPNCEPHCVATAAYPGSRLVSMNSIPALRISVDVDTCGHPRMTGSHNCTVA